MSGSHHEHLARLMDHRRLELGMKWDEVATAAGIKPPTLRAIRNGTNSPSPLTRRGLERALNWEPGSIEAILDGGDLPSPMDAADAKLDQSAHLAADLRRATEERITAQIRDLGLRDLQTVDAIVGALKKSAETPAADGETHR